MPAHATMLSPQQLTDAAKAPLLAYGRKDWDAVRGSITPDFIYDEVASQRKGQGVDAVLALWRGWATALPDSTPTFHSAVVSGNTVVLELTWHPHGPAGDAQGSDRGDRQAHRHSGVQRDRDRRRHGESEAAAAVLRHGDHAAATRHHELGAPDADTLDRLCTFFRVQPGALLEWLPSSGRGQGTKAARAKRVA